MPVRACTDASNNGGGRYEQQRDQLMGQSFNLEQTNMMTQSMQDTVTIVR